MCTCLVIVRLSEIFCRREGRGLCLASNELEFASVGISVPESRGIDRDGLNKQFAMRFIQCAVEIFLIDDKSPEPSDRVLFSSSLRTDFA